MVLMINFMNKEEFIKEIEAMGFKKKEPLLAGSNTYSKQTGEYHINIEVDFFGDSFKSWLLYEDTVITTLERMLYNDRAISIIKKLLRGFND